MRKEILLFIFMLLPVAIAITCTTRSNFCGPGEYCLFSKYQLDNSHVGNCSAYTNLVCCSDQFLKSASVKSSCDIGENGTIAMFNYTNAHAEIYTADNYNYKVCVSCPWMCELRSSCLAGEDAIASMNASTNSHVGEPGYYGLKVCCKREDVLPAYSNLGQNATVINSDEAVKLYAFWEDNGNLSHAILSTNETGVWENKSSYGSPIALNAQQAWSNFTWQNSSVYGGTTVAWRIYANDSCGNWRASDIRTFTITQVLTFAISPKLSEGIFFTNLNGSKYNVQENIDINKWNNATWNYNNTPIPGNQKTLYWIYNSGNTLQDFCLKANTDLICSTGDCVGNSISATSIAWRNSTINDASNPEDDKSERLSTSFVKVATDVQPGQYVYFRFWLFGEPYKPSGIYNTTFTVKNIPSGSSC